MTQELPSEWSTEGMMNSGSTVFDRELCRVTLLGLGVSAGDDDIGSTEFLPDCIRDDLLRLGLFGPSTLSMLLRAASEDSDTGEVSGTSSSSSEGSESSISSALSESTVAHDAVSCGFDRLVTRAMIYNKIVSAVLSVGTPAKVYSLKEAFACVEKNSIRLFASSRDQ